MSNFLAKIRKAQKCFPPSWAVNYSAIFIDARKQKSSLLPTYYGPIYKSRQGCRNPGRIEEIYPPPIVWVWSTSASPPIIWLRCTSERRCPLEFGEKKCFIFGEDLYYYYFFFGLHLNLGKKSSIFGEDLLFFWVFTEFAHLNKIVVEIHPPNVENRA